MEAHKATGKCSANDSITIGECLNSFIESKRQTIKEASLITQNGKFGYIRNTLGNVKASQMTSKRLLEWRNVLMSKYPTVYGISAYTLFCAVMKWANKIYKINIDFINEVEKPKLPNREVKEMNIYTPQEYAEVSRCLKMPYKLYFDFIFLSGCRKSEALALQVSDIDFNACIVSINKTATRQTENGKLKLTPPKSRASVRKLPMPKSLIEELREYIGERQGFVFVAEKGNLITEITTQRAFNRAISLSKQKPIRIHDLRHSHASLLISEGVSIVAVSRRLGHSTVKETLDTYAHLMPEDNAMIISIIDKIKF